MLTANKVNPIDPKLKKFIPLKIALTVFLFYHLSAVVLLPNASSIFARNLGRFFIPYANTFGLNTTWQFFSPGPSVAYHIEYEIETEATRDSDELERHVFPPPQSQFMWKESFNRRVCGLSYFTIVPERFERFFVPFLCRQTPGAVAVYVQSVLEQPSNIEKASGATSFKDLFERFEFPRQRFGCQGTDPALNPTADGASFADPEGGIER